MRKPNQTTAGNENNQRSYTTVTNFLVKNVRMWDDGNVTFVVEINGVTIYDCSVKTNKDGEDFISYPCRKGTNGKYYHFAKAVLTPADQKTILEEVERQLNSNS